MPTVAMSAHCWRTHELTKIFHECVSERAWNDRAHYSTSVVASSHPRESHERVATFCRILLTPQWHLPSYRYVHIYTNPNIIFIHRNKIIGVHVFVLVNVVLVILWVYKWQYIFCGYCILIIYAYIIVKLK